MIGNSSIGQVQWADQKVESIWLDHEFSPKLKN